MVKLKNCPFCGSDNVHLHETTVSNWGLPDKEHKYFVVSCKKCGAKGGVSSCTFINDFQELRDRLTKAEELAVTKWNNRKGAL